MYRPFPIVLLLLNFCYGGLIFTLIIVGAMSFLASAVDFEKGTFFRRYSLQPNEVGSGSCFFFVFCKETLTISKA